MNGSVGSRVRSDILVHWTGQDIESELASQPCAKAHAYLDRLTSTLPVWSDGQYKSGGLWMMTPTERIEGYKGKFFEYSLPMTCFTELRLTQSLAHASRYGFLGFGFSRSFVIKRLGCPVHYLSGTDDDVSVANLEVLRGVILQMRAKGVLFLRHGQPWPGAVDALDNALGMVVAFWKPMWQAKPGDFEYLEELEWRIVHTHRAESAGKLVATGCDRPTFKVPFARRDLRLLVVPDDTVRQLLLNTPAIMDWFRDKRGQLSLPTITTVAECGQF